MKKTKIPNTALNLVDSSCFARTVKVGEADEKPSLDMVCYSGKIIEGHWYWGNLAIDLEGMSFPKSKYPILDSHDTDRKIAFIKGKPKVTEEKELVVDPGTVSFLGTPWADEFISNSQQGFPYEASIRAYPSKIQLLQEKEEADVNGFTMKGPGTIWRNSTFKEVSICVFGSDSRTRATAFSEGSEIDLDLEDYVPDTASDEEETTFTEGDKKQMTLQELKAQYPDLFVEATLEATREAETRFTQEKEALSSDLKAAKEAVTSLEDKNRELEKQLSIREEQDRQQAAATIFTDKLVASKIPETLHEKVRKQVEYTKFVSDNVFDTNAFSKAIDEEIQDWESRIGDKIVGFGTSSKQTSQAGAPGTELQEDDAWVQKMVGFLGQTK